MATNTLTMFSYNILEDGTTTVSGAGDDLADTGYPISRLYDWSSNFHWKYTTSGTVYIAVDQGASIQSVDTLWIDNHNFNGLDLDWQYSDNNADWTSAQSWTQSDANYIIKTTTAVSKRYWRIVVTTPTNPQCGEVIMSNGDDFDIIKQPVPVHTYQSNTNWTESVSGQIFGVKFGEKRNEYAYTLVTSAAELATFNTIIDNMNDFLNPVLINDKDDNYMLARFSTTPSFSYLDTDVIDIDIRLIEVI